MLQNNIETIQNFLDTEDFNNLKSFLFSPDVEWHFHKSQTPHGNDEEYFDHCFFNKHEITSHNFKLVMPIIKKLNCKAIVQIRSNLIINKNAQLLSGFHTDYEYKCKTAILYMNTCNGYTQFENGEKVLSEENKIIMFDSNLKHAAANQTDTKQRIVININYF
jgi:ectoine hydroxylase-related dioxygenase (phytanoyl-CoA dioxygenase family)